jgi:CRISPR-associated protein Csb1
MHHKIRLNSVLPTFVPAGFVDVGHSTVRDANSGKTLVIVDSVQSIANHLEATIVAQPGQVIAGLETLPFLRLTITDPHGRSRITSSLELPHRLASGWFCRSAPPSSRFSKNWPGESWTTALRQPHSSIAPIPCCTGSFTAS